MVKKLPHSGFKWLNKKEVNDFCLSATPLNSIRENSSLGYVLEVNLEYPSELLDLHNDYPLAPEKPEIIKICCQNIVLILLMNMG